MNPEQGRYRGFAWHPNLGGQEVPGWITIGLYHLRFESDQITLSLDLRQVSIDVGDGGRTIFTAGSAPDWVVSTPDAGILKEYFILRWNHLRGQVREIRQRSESRRVLKYASAFVVGFCLIALASWLLSSITVSFLASNVPVAWEKKLGEATLTNVEKNFKLVDDPTLAAKVHPVLDRLEAALPEKRYKFQVQFIDSPMPNALALPGGRILICTGLFEMVQTPEELAGVLAHEMAHVTCRHGLRKVIAARGPYYLLQLFVRDREGFLSLIGGGSALLVFLQYSRGLETEADKVGWRILESANIDPRGLASFLRKVEAREAEQRAKLAAAFRGMVSTNQPPEILRTHPHTQKRLERLDRLWQRAKRKSGFVDLCTGAAGQ